MTVLRIEETASEGRWAQLSVAGEIDLETVPTLRDYLERARERGIDCLILDLQETSYVNSTALANLVKFAETFRETGGGISLACVSARVKLVFEMLGLLPFFKFFDTVEEARAALPAQP